MLTLRRIVVIACLAMFAVPSSAVAATRCTVTFASPTGATTYATRATTLAFTGRITGTNLRRVTVAVGTGRAVNATIAKAGAGKYTWRTGKLGLRVGRNAVKVTARLSSGAYATRTMYVTVDRTAPVISGLSPANGSTVTTSTPILSYRVNDPKARIAVTINGTPVATRSGGRLTLLQLGMNTVLVAAVDPVGNKSVVTSSFTMAESVELAPVQLFIAGSSVYITYSSELNPENTPAQDAYEVYVNGFQVEVFEVEVRESQVVLTLADPVLPGDEVTLWYTPEEIPLRDTIGNTCTPFFDMAVVNSTVPCG